MKNSFAIAALSLFNSAAAESDAIVPNFVMFGVIFTLHRHRKQTFKEKLLASGVMFCRQHKLVKIKLEKMRPLLAAIATKNLKRTRTKT